MIVSTVGGMAGGSHPAGWLTGRLAAMRLGLGLGLGPHQKPKLCHPLSWQHAASSRQPRPHRTMAAYLPTKLPPCAIVNGVQGPGKGSHSAAAQLR